MTDRPPHAAHCPFALEPAHPPDGVPLPALGQLLWRWIEAAKLHILYPYDEPDLLQAQYASLRAAAKSLDWSPGRNLFEYSRTHPQGLPALVERLTAIAAKTGAEACGCYLSTLRAGDLAAWRNLLPSALVADRSGLSRAAEHRWPGVDPNPGVHLVLVELQASPDRSRALSVRDSFCYPLYSLTRLVPIEAAHERRTWGTLLEVQDALWRSRQCLISIRKILPDASTHERGLRFQVHRHGPNGRAISTFDIYSIGDVIELEERIEEQSSEDCLYHAVARRRRMRQACERRARSGIPGGRDAPSAVARAGYSGVCDEVPEGRRSHSDCTNIQA